MFSPERARPLHEPMLGVLHEARRRRMPHTGHPLPVYGLLLETHTPDRGLLGEPCAGCHEPWPCKTAMGILGGLAPLT